MSNSSIWPIDKTLSGATTLGESRPGSNSNEGIFCIPQSCKARASPSDCLMLYIWGQGVLPFCIDAVGIFYSPSQLGYSLFWHPLSLGNFKSLSFLAYGNCWCSLTVFTYFFISMLRPSSEKCSTTVTLVNLEFFTLVIQ